MTKDTILSLLRQSPGEFVSGEVIRQAAGVSRAAVSKAVAVLRQEGHEIESVTNRGYRLISLADNLRPEELRQRLTGHHIGQEIVCLPTIDSTNNEIKRRAVSGSVDGLVILADQQTGGRGRRGRSFVSPAGKGLYLSAALKPYCPLERVSSLTAWTAVALCDAIEQVCGVRPGIKWPNDLVLQDKKLCGVLTEMELEAETGSLGYVIIGIGINLRQNEADFGPEVAPTAISLQQALGRAPDRTELAAAVLLSLDKLYQDFPERAQGYLERFRRDCLTLCRPVRVLYPGGTREGTAVDITEDFGLTVRCPDGTVEAVTSGRSPSEGCTGTYKRIKFGCGPVGPR